MDHELTPAQLHAQSVAPKQGASVDMTGAPIVSKKDEEKRLEAEGKAIYYVADDDEDFSDADEEYPTEEEKQTLRRVPESLPMSAFMVAIIELCERFTFYGISGIFQNYIQRPLDGSEGRGALGQGHVGATALSTFFQFWCYVTPILGAVIADQYLGKYKTIVLFTVVYIIGILILFLTSLPVSLENGAGLGGFIAAILTIGVGTGGIKSNVAPLIAEQYQRKKLAIRVLPSGERVIIDPAVTIQKIYMIFYFCINVGCLSLLATPYMERDVGFWSAYLMCFCVFLIGFSILILGKRKYVVRPPRGSVITDAFKALWIMVRHQNQNAPKPSMQMEKGWKDRTPWDDHFIDELKRALIGCQVFVFYPIYWVCYSQFSNNFVSQAAQMNGHGIPNDLMQNFDPIAIIVFIPILNNYVYPLLRKARIPFRPISRISVGFCVAAMGMLYACVVQHSIYQQGPCYDHPLCEASEVDGVVQPADIHIAIQTPAYVLIGLSEIFASVSGLEYAYLKAPPSMKSFVQSMYLLTTAFGSALGIALSPTAADPKAKWMFAGLAISAFCTGVIFFLIFRKNNAKEEAWNALEASGDKAVGVDEAKRTRNSIGRERVSSLGN